MSPALAGRFFATGATGRPKNHVLTALFYVPHSLVEQWFAVNIGQVIDILRTQRIWPFTQLINGNSGKERSLLFLSCFNQWGIPHSLLFL